MPQSEGEKIDYWPYAKVTRENTYVVKNTDDVSWAEASEQAQIHGCIHIDWRGITYRTYDAYLIGVTNLVMEQE